jgi:hypothetical protein
MQKDNAMNHTGADVPRTPLLGPNHTGMRVSASGILTRIARGDRPDAGVRYMVGEMLKHLEQLGRDYYDGKPLIVDEFLQCYCLDDNRPNPTENRTGHLVDGTVPPVVGCS